MLGKDSQNNTRVYSSIFSQYYNLLPPWATKFTNKSERQAEGRNLHPLFTCGLPSCASIAYMKEIGIKGKYMQDIVILEAKH